MASSMPSRMFSTLALMPDFVFAVAFYVGCFSFFVLRKLDLIHAVVDTSSILEHREELRELWEKRMMADENQSSTSSTVAETNNPKPRPEEENEEEVSKTKSESETNPHKMSNGFAKPVDDNISPDDTNANHIHEEIETKQEVETSSNGPIVDADHENNNSADSLEEDNADDYVEEKTYTSKLENALVVTQVKEVVTSETIVSTTSIEEQHVAEENSHNESFSEESVTTTRHESDSQVVEIQEAAVTAEVQEEVSSTSTENALTSSETVTQSSEEVLIHEEVVTSSSSSAEVHHREVEMVETVEIQQMKNIEIEKVDENDDGFVRVEECLPHVDSTADSVDHAQEETSQDFIEEPEISSTNGYEEHPQAPASLSDSVHEDKASHPEMEQFVKSGGVKRILPGVQKTEQPYNTCTTETKIAMEIREMREREEELRIMREQALLSPVVSPVPPKSPVARSPSPAIKEAHSPTPSGPGYRVSSVFGHKGTTSPSPPVYAEEEKKVFKGFTKETAVEKEIRLARDREEELRKQKGLPPRDDDSYVKPSQVKSSQVRVFGKMVGTNNNSVKQAATAKIQMEIEEQTQREMALRETGHIQTISQERTDAKVAKLKTAEAPATHTNGNSHTATNGNYTNGRSSPDVGTNKRSTPSPTGPRPASIFAQNNGIPKSNISMHKFIASKGKETTFSAPRNGGPFQPKEESVTRSVVPPPMVKLKRNLSVESKIQQEILEMKQREEELKKLHMNRNIEDTVEGNGIDHEMNQKNNLIEYENGNGISDEEISPRHNKLIAQWEQRIQKAES